MVAGVRVGDLVEDFELPDETGASRRLSEFLASGPVVLFFYPAAMTRGCTAESCHFRDLAAEFAAVGASRVGISRDAVERQAEFSRLHGFDYPLLSDVDGVVARRFGVLRRLPLGPLSTRRMTFVIGVDRRVVEVVHSELGMNEHADRALRALGG
ncbi:peroxiredoxin Q/BCP [Micromonospora haikouensis]|uniref:thioredoxin-dependent peroxiredoxin n=1 Tax=Micromonospora haikouensis TaxID=686309 RepID=A0A1C4YH16_9ACTN|nr:peroxiredoxin Q/BCP [Micromonospora haikouensis]